MLLTNMSIFTFRLKANFKASWRYVIYFVFKPIFLIRTLQAPELAYRGKGYNKAFVCKIAQYISSNESEIYLAQGV